VAHNPQKGVLILSMPRAGSNWLGSLTNATGLMGHSQEWLDFGHLKGAKGETGRGALFRRTLQSASTENGRFAVKIFPRQLLQVIDEYNLDFIRRCRRQNDVKLVLLHREDRIAQAVSLVRAMQTGKWTTTTDTQKSRQNTEAHYSFKTLCQAYFHIGRGYAFWESYLTLNELSFESFSYETLHKNPEPYFECLASHMGVATPESQESTLEIQRDSLSTEWQAKFKQEIKERGIPAIAYQQKQPEPSLGNAIKVLRGKPAKITRFGYSV